MIWKVRGVGGLGNPCQSRFLLLWILGTLMPAISAFGQSVEYSAPAVPAFLVVKVVVESTIDNYCLSIPGESDDFDWIQGR